MLNSVRVQYGGRVVLDDISLAIGPRERVGLVGRNGAGKSTLMKIIAGQMVSGGNVSKPSVCKIGYLHQDMLMPAGRTVIEETLTAFAEVKEAERKLAEVSITLAERDDYESDEYMKLIEEYSHNEELVRILGGDTMQADAERVLLGLGFKSTDFEKPTAEFSGGWKMRVELAKIILSRPDYMLLDEPTNHLDIESIIWLEGFLQDYEGTVIIISHDRTFLDAITRRTIEIELGRASDYKANYSDYLEQRVERRELMQNAYDNQQAQIAQIQKNIDRFRAKANKAAFAQSLIKQLDRMERVEMDDEDTSGMRLKFAPAPRSGDVVVEAVGVSKSFGPKHVLSKLDFQLDRGDRVSFVGKNGEGKTTFTKIILDMLDIEDGKIKLGHNVNVGYYAQNQADALDPNMTVYETIERDCPWEMRTRLRAILGSFLFGGEDIDKKVSVLSGGERARLAMACMLLRPINLLILDEPTNHLDIISKDILKDAILKYDGTLIVVSHDRDFLTGLTDKTIEFSNQKIKTYLGDIQYFLEKRNFGDMRSVAIGKNDLKAATEAKNNTDKTVDANSEEQKKVQKNIQLSEKRIEKLESELKQTEEKMATTVGTPEYDRVYENYLRLKNNLDEEMAKWESLMES